MKRRYVYDAAHGKMVEVTEGTCVPEKPSHQIMKDIAPYKSMITGEEITSRSRHREHLKAHGCIEVGDQVKYMVKNIRRPESPPGLHEAIQRAAYKHGILK
jgi:hypothetical protein